MDSQRSGKYELKNSSQHWFCGSFGKSINESLIQGTLLDIAMEMTEIDSGLHSEHSLEHRRRNGTLMDVENGTLIDIKYWTLMHVKMEL